MPDKENTLRIKTGKFDLTIYVEHDSSLHDPCAATNEKLDDENQELRVEIARLIATNAAYTEMTEWMHRVFRDDIVAEESGAEMAIRLLKRVLTNRS